MDNLKNDEREMSEIEKEIRSQSGGLMVKHVDYYEKNEELNYIIKDYYTTSAFIDGLEAVQSDDINDSFWLEIRDIEIKRLKEERDEYVSNAYKLLFY